MQVAVSLTIATALQPVIDEPPAVKLTVPDAPEVTVATNVTFVPTVAVSREAVIDVVDTEPGITAMRGAER